MNVFYQDHSMSFFSKITVNNCYPAHLHKEIELIYCISGCLTITIDGISHELNKGDLTICFPDIVHRVQTSHSSEALLLIFSPDFVPDFNSEFRNSHPKSSYVSASEISDQSRALLTELTMLSKEPKDLRLNRAYLSALIWHINQVLVLVPNRNMANQAPIQMILAYVHTHLKESLSLDLLSRELGFSRFYISHLFSEKIGISFSSYVNRERTKLAAELLKDPKLDITDVCFQSGFTSIRTFYRSFHEVYQKTPKEYREL